jgi:hypothetical protein
MDAFTHRHVGERNAGSEYFETHFAGARVREVFLDRFQLTLAVDDNAPVLHVRKSDFGVVFLI